MKGSSRWATKAVFLALGAVGLAILLGLSMDIVVAADPPPDFSSPAELEAWQERARWYSVVTSLAARLIDAALTLAVVALALAALAIAQRPAPPGP